GRDVEDLPGARRRLTAAPREVGGAARAAVERVARTAQHATEFVPHPAQARDLRVDLVDLRRNADPHRVRRTPAVDQPQVLLDLRQREAEALRLLDRADEPYGLLVVRAVSGGRARRLGQEPAPLVVAQRLDIDARPRGHL